MKYILIAMMMMGTAMAQTKGDNTIVVHNATLDSVINRALDLGYHLDKVNSEYKTAQTRPNFVGQVIYFRQKGSDVYIDSDIMIRFMNIDTRDPVMYHKLNKRWKEMQSISDSYKSVEYIKL